MVRTPLFHCSIAGQGTKIPKAAQRSQKKKKKKKGGRKEGRKNVNVLIQRIAKETQPLNVAYGQGLAVQDTVGMIGKLSKVCWLDHSFVSTLTFCLFFKVFI